MDYKKIVNILLITGCVLLVMGVIFSFAFKKTVNFIDQPVVNNINDKVKESWNAYENINYYIDYPGDWKYEIIENTTTFESTKNNNFTIKIENLSGLLAREKLTTTNLSVIQKYYIYDGDKLFSMELVKNTENISDNEKKEVRDIFDKMYASVKSNQSNNRECKPAGCSSQICSRENIITTCEYLDYYSCFQQTSCQTQPSGMCGWEINDEFLKCLKNNSGLN